MTTSKNKNNNSPTHYLKNKLSNRECLAVCTLLVIKACLNHERTCMHVTLNRAANIHQMSISSGIGRKALLLNHQIIR